MSEERVIPVHIETYWHRRTYGRSNAGGMRPVIHAVILGDRDQPMKVLVEYDRYNSSGSGLPTYTRVVEVLDAHEFEATSQAVTGQPPTS